MFLCLTLDLRTFYAVVYSISKSPQLNLQKLRGCNKPLHRSPHWYPCPCCNSFDSSRSFNPVGISLGVCEVKWMPGNAAIPHGQAM